jgi:hypothetical protein
VLQPTDPAEPPEVVEIAAYRLPSPANRQEFVMTSNHLSQRLRAFAAALPLLLAASHADAEYPDWSSVAEVPVIEIITTDADGDSRVTKVWFVLVDGEAYLRTNDSRWLANLRRSPELGLRIDGHDYEAAAREVPGDEIIESVDAASAEKYGWQETLIHPFRIRTPQILKLAPRPSVPNPAGTLSAP